MIHEIYELYLMAWHVAEVMLKISFFVSVLVVLVLMVVYTYWPEWTQDSDPDPMLARLLARYPRSEYVTRYVEDHTVAEWESSEAYRQMVLDACERLHKGSIGHGYTANRGENRTVIYDVSEAEYSRLLEQDPESYEQGR